MKTKRRRAASPNSVIFLEDVSGGELEDFDPMVEPRMGASPSMIWIGCLSFMDGTTEFVLGSAEEVTPDQEPIFDDVLETPSRAVAIRTSHLRTILGNKVPTSSTRVRIWTNDPSEPDRVIIGLGD